MNKIENKNNEIYKKKIFFLPDFLFNLDLKLNFLRVILI